MKPERLPSGSYRIRYTDPWGRRRAVTRRTAADARAAYRHILGDIARGDYTDPRRGRITFGAWCDDWLAGARNLGTGGRDTYRRDLDRHILPELGKVPVGRLSADDIDRYLTGLGQRPPDGRPAKGLAHSPGASGTGSPSSSDGLTGGDERRQPPRSYQATAGRTQGLAPSTVHRHYRTIHRALAVAVDRGLIPRNPADKVQPPKLERREVTVLTVEQIDALADAISPRYRAWVFVAAYGGLRWSETIGLRRMDVDGPVVRVAGQLVKRGSGWERCETKTGRPRTITLPAFAAGELASHLDTYSLPGSDGLVFPTRNGTPPQAPSWTANTFRRALQQAGLPRMRVHDFRHCAVSLALNVGANPLISQQRAGHSSASVHQDVYGHLMAGADQAVADALDQLRAESRRRRLRAV